LIKEYIVNDLKIDFDVDDSLIAEYINADSKHILLELYWRTHPRFSFIKNCGYKTSFLDIGVGSGLLPFWKDWLTPKRNDIEMYGVDLKQPQPDFLKNYKEFGCVNIDDEFLPFKDNFFNSIFMSHVFEHLKNPIFAVKEINRVLKHRGQVYIEIPSPLTIRLPQTKDFLCKGLNIVISNFYDDSTHVNTYETNEIANMFFENSRVNIISNSGSIYNDYLQDILSIAGIENNDSELLTYGIWSKLRWANYIILEKG
jgi:SAM-dependent methyltransferase